MPFFPLIESTPARRQPQDFPRVSADEQAVRDDQAERVLRDEFEQDMPDDSRAALEREYRNRFGKESPTQAVAQQRGFIPLANADEKQPTRGFIPLAVEKPESPSLLKTIALENPGTALGETVLNLGSQIVALPVAGWAGLATLAGNALGLTDKSAADVVRSVGDALTYQPRGEMGKGTTEIVTYPFQKLAEAGQAAGGKVLDVTGSPAAATVVDTAINALPMAIGPAAKAAKRAKGIQAEVAPRMEPTITPETVQGFVPLDAERAARAPEAIHDEMRAQLSARDDRAPQHTQENGFRPSPSEWDSGLPAAAGDLRTVPEGHGVEANAAALALSEERAGQLRAGELRMADPVRAEQEPGLTPENAANVEAIDSRLTEIADDLPRRTAPVQASLQREAARLQQEKAEILGAPAGQIEAELANGPAQDVAGEKLNHEWTAFAEDSGTLGIPRAEMPQIKAEHRGAMTNFMNARGVQHQLEEVAPDSLKPTQLEFSPAKVKKAIGFEGGDRSILVSSDNYVLDGHHQWLAKRETGDPIKVIRLDAPIHDLIQLAHDFPSSQTAKGATASLSRQGAEAVGAEPNALAMVAERTARSPESIPDDGRANAMAPGVSYTGFIDDAPRSGSGEPGTASVRDSQHSSGPRPEPIRREDILVPFLKALNTGIYEGRVKGKGVMGFFRPKTQEVRIKRHADLETASHELAHLMDARIPEIRKSWTSGENWQIHREELLGVSYDAKKIYEGFAEFVRLHMTQPDVARAKAPVFSKWFEDFTNRHEYGPAIRKAQAGMTEWYGQDAVDRARSKIGDHAPLSDALDGGWDRWRQSIVDDLHGVYRMERELQGGKIAPIGAYESARLARASHSIADGALRFGAPVKKADGSFAWKGKGLEEILKPVAHSMDDALLYFVGRSARELMTQGREHLFTPGEVDAMLRLKRPEFDQAFKEYQAWNKGVLDFAEAQGVINPEARALWQRTQYLPFHRVGQAGGFKGKPGDWSGVKALTGGTENIRDILGNMTSNAAQLIDKAVKNEARLKIAELAEKIPGGGKFMTKIPAESRPIRIDSRQVVDALMKSMGIESGAKLAPAVTKAVKELRKELENAPAMLELMQTNMPPAGGNVVAVLKGGKPTWYEVGDPLLFRALQSIDRPLQSAVVKFLGWFKRAGQMTITLTPDFMIANIARDTIMGSVMSRAGFRTVVDSLQGMRLRLSNDPLYKEFIANGGGMSSIFLDETRFRAKLEKFYQRQGIDYRTVLDAPGKVMNFLETLADSFEMSTRLGEYKRAIDAGEHPRHAAYLGREVSTDFSMKGDSQAAGFMFDTVMFLRPALISLDRLYRGIAHDPNKLAIAAKTGTLAMMSMALYLLNKDDPRYQDLNDWDKDGNWHFFVGEQHFRYPKIWELGSVASIAERTAEKVINEDPMGLGKDIVRILGTTFHLNLMPQFLAPLAEQATNRNSFTNAPIETPGMENMQPFLRAKPTTNETLKAAGMLTRDMPEAMQVNPVRTEALLRGYFNTWAMYGLMLTDKALFGDKLPEMRTDQLPVVRRFYSQEPPQHTKFETQFYDMLGEAKRLHGTLRELDHLGRPDLADVKEKEPLASEAKPLERAAKNLSGINKDMLAVRRSDATPEEKRQQLDALTVERNALLKAAVLDSKAAQRETTK
jgi:hypothetical protein